MFSIRDQIIKTRKPKQRYSIFWELGNRFSPRHYTRERIPIAHMHSIIEAARWTPSGYNAQPWYFYWTRNGSNAFNALMGSLPNFNMWANSASVLVVACFIGKNERGSNEFALYDLGAAVLALVLEGQHLGYFGRQMGIFDKKKVKQVIKANVGEEPFVIIALGKLGDYTKASEDIIQRDMTPTSRKIDIAKQID